MRLLLDHCVPARLAGTLLPHEARTAAGMGWERLKNGALLRAAAEAGFDALITTDRNLRFQQSLAALPIAVVVLVAASNRAVELERVVPILLETLAALPACVLVEVAAP